MNTFIFVLCWLGLFAFVLWVIWNLAKWAEKND